MYNSILMKIINGVNDLHRIEFHNLFRYLPMRLQQFSQLATLNELHDKK